MTTLLILTTGQSDVQLVSGGERRELDTRQCGVLHDEIAKRRWAVVPPPTAKVTDRATALPDGDLTLCTPKLEAVLRWFGEDLPTAALIFETGRTLPSDPRLAGAVLAKRLDDMGVTDVHRHAFLEGKDRLEDPSKPDEGVIRRQIVTGLSSQIAARLGSVKPDRVVVATTGGLAAANEVIQELVRLHAVGRKVISLEVADGAVANRGDVAVPEKFHPAAGFRARWHALSLIEKGNLLGAWGAVSHLDGQAGEEWVLIVRWLANFASSLPIADDCYLPSMKHPRMAVRAALRVELALRSGDIPRAVHGTVAFFEAALWDWIRQHDFGQEGISGTFESGFSRNDGTKLGARFRKGGINDFDLGVQAWLDVLAKPGLSAFRSALTDDLRALRNDVAHNEPTPELMDNARAKMRSAALWSDANRFSFLSQPLVQNVLNELGVTEPDKVLTELLDTVRHRLVSVTHA